MTYLHDLYQDLYHVSLDLDHLLLNSLRRAGPEHAKVTWQEKRCVPDARLSAHQLEELIEKACRSWRVGKESSPKAHTYPSSLAVHDHF